MVGSMCAVLALAVVVGLWGTPREKGAGDGMGPSPNLAVRKEKGGVLVEGWAGGGREEALRLREERGGLVDEWHRREGWQ